MSYERAVHGVFNARHGGVSRLGKRMLLLCVEWAQHKNPSYLSDKAIFTIKIARSAVVRGKKTTQGGKHSE